MENEPVLLLSSLYPTASTAIAVARRAKLPIPFILAEGRAIDVWSSILEEAEKRHLLNAIAEIVDADYPGSQAGKAVLNWSAKPINQPNKAKANLKGNISAFEKIISDQPTFLPLTFFEVGIERAQSVARVRCKDGLLGTGFLISGNRLVTNSHVLSSIAQAESAVAEFNYQISRDGSLATPSIVHFDPTRFWSWPEDDLTIIGVHENANEKWGEIDVFDVTVEPGNYVNIIQHPGGGPKQIALYDNVVVYNRDSRIGYSTDTLPGSSGSPVFDSDWRLVAIHHASVRFNTASGFANEGIAVTRLAELLSQLDR